MGTLGSVIGSLMTTGKSMVGETPCRCSSRTSQLSHMLSRPPGNLAFRSASPTGVATRQLSTVLAACVDTIAAFLLVVAVDITCAAESNKKSCLIRWLEGIC